MGSREDPTQPSLPSKIPAGVVEWEFSGKFSHSAPVIKAPLSDLFLPTAQGPGSRDLPYVKTAGHAGLMPRGSTTPDGTRPELKAKGCEGNVPLFVVEIIYAPVNLNEMLYCVFYLLSSFLGWQVEQYFGKFFFLGGGGGQGCLGILSHTRYRSWPK